MQRVGKSLSYGIGILFLVLIAAISFTVGWRPFIGPKSRPLTSRKFEVTPQRLQRGKYLFIGLAGCAGCHSPHDWKSHGAPIPEGAEGQRGSHAAEWSARNHSSAQSHARSGNRLGHLD